MFSLKSLDFFLCPLNLFRRLLPLHPLVALEKATLGVALLREVVVAVGGAEGTPQLAQILLQQSFSLSNVRVLQLCQCRFVGFVRILEI